MNGGTSWTLKKGTTNEFAGATDLVMPMMIGPTQPQRTSPKRLATLDDLQHVGTATDVDFEAVF